MRPKFVRPRRQRPRDDRSSTLIAAAADTFTATAVGFRSANSPAGTESLPTRSADPGCLDLPERRHRRVVRASRRSFFSSHRTRIECAETANMGKRGKPPGRSPQGVAHGRRSSAQCVQPGIPPATACKSRGYISDPKRLQTRRSREKAAVGPNIDNSPLISKRTRLVETIRLTRPTDRIPWTHP